jgi:hypothetical protein
MNREKPSSAKASVVVLALTWDGARWPLASLPPKARVFFRAGSAKKITPFAAKMAALLTDDQVQEIRICWVPRLKGGSDVLTNPFITPDGLRMAFRMLRTAHFGDVLGVVYRRSQ